MTSIRTWLIAAAMLATAFAMVPAGCSAAEPNVLTVGNPFSPLSMDPARSGNGRAGTHLMPAYEPLVRVRPDGTFEPALAVAWELSADSTSATFTLRRDARFSDGESVTADAARQSIDYWRHANGPFAVNLRNVVAIDVLDRFRFRIRLSSPNPALINLFEAYWLSGDLISPRALKDPASLRTATAGAGPYKLDPAASVTGKSYTYVPNEFYYDKSRVRWDRIVLTVFEDQNSAIQALKAGQIQLLVSDPLTAHANENRLGDHIRIVSNPAQWVGLVLNDRDGVANPSLKDVRVRQAINYALDRPLIARAFFGSLAQPTDQLQGPGFAGHDDANEAMYPFDPAKARALLAAAGHGNGVELRLAYLNSTLNALLAQVVVAELRKVGIHVKTDEYQNYGALNFAAKMHAFDAVLSGSNSGVPNIARFQTLDPEGSLNYYRSTDAGLSALLSTAASLPLNASEQAWKNVYARVVDLAWFAPLVASNIVYLASDRVELPRPGLAVVIDLINVVPRK